MTEPRLNEIPVVTVALVQLPAVVSEIFLTWWMNAASIEREAEERSGIAERRRILG